MKRIENSSFVNCLIFMLLIWMAMGCRQEKPIAMDHYFADKQWERFNYLSFEIPVETTGKYYDIVLTATFSIDYAYETLDFNMVLKTSSGDERIKEYQMKVKSKEGTFQGEVSGDTCVISMPLKRQFRISKPGLLKIELENLIPRMATEGIHSIGIRLVSSGKSK